MSFVRAMPITMLCIAGTAFSACATAQEAGQQRARQSDASPGAESRPPASDQYDRDRYGAYYRTNAYDADLDDPYEYDYQEDVGSDFLDKDDAQANNYYTDDWYVDQGLFNRWYFPWR